MSSRSICPTTGLALQAGERRQERRATRQPSTRPPPSGDAGGHTRLLGAVLDGKYRVVSVIGQGGMGTVFEAEHLAIGRKVAVKVLKPEHAKKRENVERMRHEARVVAQIGHPNICEIFDIAQLQDGCPYLVMERLTGETLARRIERAGPVSVPELVEIMLQVLEGLEAAHAKNVIHRDMKPDNIFLAERSSGRVAKILDFGISKATAPDEQPHHLTRTGMVMGTPYYMAPEQAMGDRSLDGRVDVWGAGVVMYEALTGVRPFVAKNYNALLVQILSAQATPIETLRPEIPRALAAVVRKALEKKREARFGSVRELAEALRPFGTGGAVPRPGPSARVGSPAPQPSRAAAGRPAQPTGSSTGGAARGAPAPAGSDRARSGPSGLPRVTLFPNGEESSSSSFGADEETTVELQRFPGRASRPEEPLPEEDIESTVVDDPPSFQDSDADTDRHPRRGGS